MPLGILSQTSNQFLLGSFRDGNCRPVLSGNVGESGEFESWVLRGTGGVGGRSGDYLDGN
jgi:hypothetical protein